MLADKQYQFENLSIAAQTGHMACCLDDRNFLLIFYSKLSAVSKICTVVLTSALRNTRTPTELLQSLKVTAFPLKKDALPILFVSG